MGVEQSEYGRRGVGDGFHDIILSLALLDEDTASFKRQFHDRADEMLVLGIHGVDETEIG
jgi:hypothetical protein